MRDRRDRSERRATRARAEAVGVLALALAASTGPAAEAAPRMARPRPKGSSPVAKGVIPAGPGSLAPRPGPDGRRRAGKDAPRDFLRRFARSYVPGRSGSLFFVTHPGYQFTFSGVPYNHGSPWDYDSHVPLVFYGPGQIRTGPVDEPARPYDIAATLSAALVLPPPPGSRGKAWRRILVDGPRPRAKALVIVMMDQVGFQDVERFAASMPTLNRWRREGADFRQARLDYLPSFTAVSHTSVGTGAPPAVHGIASNMIPGERGELEVVFRQRGERVDPSQSRVPTFADWMDQALDNEPIVLGQVYAEYAVTGLTGHGAMFPGGDRDVAVWHGKSGRMTTDRRWFRVPGYIAERDSRALVERKGGKFMEFDLSRPGKEHEAAWYAAWEAEGMLTMMRREGVGRDEVPDLVLVNLKSTDAFGHQHGHDHPGYRAAMREVDAFLAQAEDYLQRVAPGAFVFAVTADHGLVPDDGTELIHDDYVKWLGEALDRTGDQDGRLAVTDVFGGQVYLDRHELRQEGHGLASAARILRRDPAIRYVWTEDEVRRMSRRLGYSTR